MILLLVAQPPRWEPQPGERSPNLFHSHLNTTDSPESQLATWDLWTLVCQWLMMHLLSPRDRSHKVLLLCQAGIVCNSDSNQLTDWLACTYLCCWSGYLHFHLSIYYSSMYLPDRMVQKKKEEVFLTDSMHLPDFVQRYSKSFPVRIQVMKGYCGPSSRFTISTCDTYNIHFLKHTKVVTIKELWICT